MYNTLHIIVMPVKSVANSLRKLILLVSAVVRLAILISSILMQYSKQCTLKCNRREAFLRGDQCLYLGFAIEDCMHESLVMLIN